MGIRNQKVESARSYDIVTRSWMWMAGWGDWLIASSARSDALCGTENEDRDQQEYKLSACRPHSP